MTSADDFDRPSALAVEEFRGEAGLSRSGFAADQDNREPSGRSAIPRSTECPKLVVSADELARRLGKN